MRVARPFIQEMRHASIDFDELHGMRPLNRGVRRSAAASLSKPAAKGAAKPFVAFVQAGLGCESNRRIRGSKQIIVSPLNDFEEETVLKSRRINVEKFTALVSIIEYTQTSDVL
jgi:hypothetical protein